MSFFKSVCIFTSPLGFCNRAAHLIIFQEKVGALPLDWISSAPSPLADILASEF